MSGEAEEEAHSVDTLNLQAERGVLFAEIRVPPMNILGREVVRDLRHPTH